MTATDTEERVVVDVDLDLVLPCNIRRQKDCEQPADWVWHCQTCGHVWQPCSTHRVVLDVWRATVLRRVVCEDCNSFIPNPIPWSPI